MSDVDEPLWVSRTGPSEARTEAMLVAAAEAEIAAQIADYDRRYPWREGEPPRDGNDFEMRRCERGIHGTDVTYWEANGKWDGKRFVRSNQFTGGTEPLLDITHWRRAQEGLDPAFWVSRQLSKELERHK